MDFLDELRALTAKDIELLGPFCVHEKYIKPAIVEIERRRSEAAQMAAEIKRLRDAE